MVGSRSTARQLSIAVITFALSMIFVMMLSSYALAGSADSADQSSTPQTSVTTISSDTTWSEQDLSGDYVLVGNPTITVVGEQWVLQDVHIYGQGTIKRGASYTGNLFGMGDGNQDATRYFSCSFTIDGNITIDGNSDVAGTVERAIINMTPPKITYTLNLGGDVVIQNAKVTSEYQGAAIWATPTGQCGGSGNVIINMYDNAKITGNDGCAIYSERNGSGGSAILNLSGNASVSGNGGGGIFGFDTVNMSGKSAVSNNTISTATGGGYGLCGNSTTSTTIKMSEYSTVSGNAATGITLASGSLTMSDNAAVSGNGNSGNGGGICCNNSPVVLQGSASVTGNSSKGTGGGLYLTGTSTLQMKDTSSVTDNSADVDGGGLAVANGSGLIRILGGTISGNTAKVRGGGAFIDITATTAAFLLGGGTVTQNTAGTYGSGIYSTGDFYIQDSPVVKSNTSSETKGNIYIPSGKRLRVPSGKTLTGEDASIGITYASPAAWAVVLTQLPSGTAITDQDAKLFYDSTTSGWHIAVDYTSGSHTATVGNLVLYPNTPIAITATAGEHGKIDPTEQTVGYGATATVTATPDNGYVIDKMTVDGSEVAPAANGSYTIAKVTHDTTVNVTFKKITYTSEQLAGSNRYETMQRICAAAFPSGSKSDVAILASGANFPDALSASALAGIKNAPILLTDPNTLSASASAEIERLGVKQVIIVGGGSAVSENVEIAVKGLSSKPTVSRAWGGSRTLTAVDVLNFGSGSWSDTLILASGNNFPDALSISAYANASGSPILLTSGDGTLDAATVKAAKGSGCSKVLIVGGESAVSDSVMSQLGSGFEYYRLGGGNRYQTSSNIAKWECGEDGSATFQPSVTLSYLNVACATGKNFPDALAGCVLCGQLRAPLLLVDDSDAGTYNVTVTLAEHAGNISKCYFLGGDSAIDAALRARIDEVCVG